MTVTQPTLLERDPVCGMNVNPASAKHVYEHGGKKYYFCCASCAEKFKADPPEISEQACPVFVEPGDAGNADCGDSHSAAGAQPVTIRPASKPAAAAAAGICVPDVSRGPREQAGSVPVVRHGA